MIREEIKNNLYTGDYIRIADTISAKGEKYKTDRKYVSDVINGRGKGIRGIALLIWQEAEKLAIANLSLKKSA